MRSGFRNFGAQFLASLAGAGWCSSANPLCGEQRRTLRSWPGSGQVCDELIPRERNSRKEPRSVELCIHPAPAAQETLPYRSCVGIAIVLPCQFSSLKDHIISYPAQADSARAGKCATRLTWGYTASRRSPLRACKRYVCSDAADCPERNWDGPRVVEKIGHTLAEPTVTNTALVCLA